MTDRHLTSQGAERKQQLLDAAARLFAEQGYSATRVVDIVDAAGVAKGLFYWYFENKEAVFRELATSIRQRLRRHQSAAMDPEGTALDRLVQGAVASVQFMAEHAHFFSLLEVEGRNVSDVLRVGTEQHVADVAVLIREGRTDGTVTAGDPPERLALAVVGIVGQFSYFHRAQRVDMSLDDLSAFVARLVARMLAADEHAARTSLLALHRRLAAPAVTP
ncbi:MAG TPA: helix-turn-helix domain-containing protein [Acidimicrobiales bacterium]